MKKEDRREPLPSSSSKKSSRKKEKEYEKAQQRLERIEKLHYQIYQIPPYSQEHLRALLVEYMCSSAFECPVHECQLFETIRNFYKNTKNVDTYMKDLDLKSIIQELHRMYLSMSEQINCHFFDIVFQGGYTSNVKVLVVDDIDFGRLRQLAREFEHEKPVVSPPDAATFQLHKHNNAQSAIALNEKEKLSKLLKMPSLFQESNKFKKDLESLNQRKSFAETAFLEEYRKKFETQNVEYCDYCTKEKCVKAKGKVCNKRHFKKIIKPNTEESSGNCPHLNACLNPECKHIHYVEDDENSSTTASNANQQLKIAHIYSSENNSNRNYISETQWINCDLRFFDFKVLGKFNVIMADPPWDIHMTLPYGTLKDKEMLNLRVDLLQDEGMIFLWVTGRAMELGRECLTKWGYHRVEEIVWIKTNQLQRLIITGRTGHWLNHTKQHCLVGMKGSPKIRRNVDCDVLVAKVRETSRKPDEIYSLIERVSPGGKKIQLFGRPHNCKPGWITLGNQLPGAYIKDQQILARYKRTYPQQDLSEARMMVNLKTMQNTEQVNAVYNSHISKNKELVVSGGGGVASQNF